LKLLKEEDKALGVPLWPSKSREDSYKKVPGPLKVIGRWTVVKKPGGSIYIAERIEINFTSQNGIKP